MQHEILPNGNLRISITPLEREKLIVLATEHEGDFDSDLFTFEVLEPLVCNSELKWSSAEEIGALTDAPILAIYGEPCASATGETISRGNRLTGHWDEITWVEPIDNAWAWMNYHVQSVQRALLETGEAIWQKGWDDAETK